MMIIRTNYSKVYNLETYKRIAVISGHRGSVLSLTLSEDGQMLFSSAGDRFVNVWDTKTLLRLYSIYSMYDIGDVFCVLYSSSLNTVYLGAQNTSIQVDQPHYSSLASADSSSGIIWMKKTADLKPNQTSTHGSARTVSLTLWDQVAFELLLLISTLLQTGHLVNLWQRPCSTRSRSEQIAECATCLSLDLDHPQHV